MKIELIEIDKLIPFEKNPKVHPVEQIDKIVRSISEFGFTNPILALKENNMIIAGHARLKAAQKMNLAQVPVIFLDMPYEKAIAYVVTDNRLAELAEWDEQILLPLLEDIKTQGIDIELTGFTLADISIMGKKDVQEDNFDPDAVAAAIKEPITKPGDIWILGKHKLLCSDATNAEEMARLMGGHFADMVFTDPPYSVNYEKKNKEVLHSKSYSKITGDDKNVNDLAHSLWKPVFDNLAMCSKDGASIYVTMPQGGDQMMMMMMMMMDSWKVKHELIWVKESPVFSMGRLDYDYMHEPILYGWKKTHNFYGGGEHKKSVWFIKRDGNKSHPTMKPVALIANAINNSSKQGDIIIDFFGGSGTTIMASEQLGRVGYLCEIDRVYCDVIVQRYVKFVGSSETVYRVSINGTKTPYKELNSLQA